MRSVRLIWPLLAVCGLAIARRSLDVVEVRGRSMAPALLPGDRLLVARLPARVGDVVLAADPREAQRELIKRVASADERGVILRGDNPAFSTDTRTFGALPAGAVQWRVIGRYWPVGRVGRVGRGSRSEPEPLDLLDAGGEPACTFPEALIAGPDRPRPEASWQPTR